MFGSQSRQVGALTAFLRKFFGKGSIRSLDSLQGWERADAIFHNLSEEGKVPGMAVTIMEKGDVQLQKGYGYANLEHNVPVDPEHTVFRIASISKCITGLALAKMAEEGMLNLDDSVYLYVAGFPQKKHDFSLRQLATHTAGIRGYRGKEFALNKPFSIKDSLEVFQNDPLQFEPGQGYLYNSYDFVLLAHAMEVASGVSFEEYVRQRVLEPLKMTHTFAPHREKDMERLPHKGTNLAEFYTKRAGYFTKAVPVNNYYKLAGGGYLSTSSDIVKLGQAVLGKKLLAPESWSQVLRSATVNGKPTYYGLGFQVSQDKEGRHFVGHVGNSVGAYTNFFVYPEEERICSLLINCTDPKVQEDLDNALKQS